MLIDKQKAFDYIKELALVKLGREVISITPVQLKKVSGNALADIAVVANIYYFVKITFTVVDDVNTMGPGKILKYTFSLNSLQGQESYEVIKTNLEDPSGIYFFAMWDNSDTGDYYLIDGGVFTNYFNYAGAIITGYQVNV